MTKPLALVVEDDPQLSDIFTFTLSELFDVEAVMDGARALARLSEVVPHLIVLDINLPGASGTQILHSVRADSRFDAMRIILATANPILANDLQDKVDIVLLKPISPAQLRDFAKRLL